MIHKDLVSTIVPVFDRDVQLRTAVQSVFDQDYRPIEVIVVNDGSTDQTLAVAQTIAAEHPDMVRVTSQANAGPGAARERGRQMAHGEFIQYLDSDDILLPGKFTAQVKALQVNPDCQVAYGMTRFRHADGTFATGAWKGSGISRAAMFPSFLTERWWDTPNPLYRKEICDLAGPWTDLRLEEDWEYDCRIASLGARLVWCEQYVCEVRDHAGDRLCRGSNLDPMRMRDRARSHALIDGRAVRAGIAAGSPEMQHFARALFLLARQCGAAGLPAESRQLFELAPPAASRARAGWISVPIGAWRRWPAGPPRVGQANGWTAFARASQHDRSIRRHERVQRRGQPGREPLPASSTSRAVPSSSLSSMTARPMHPARSWTNGPPATAACASSTRPTPA